MPWGVAVDKKELLLVAEEELIVADFDNHCISVYDKEGKKVRSFGSKGTKEGQFTRPRGVAVTNDGHILVTDEHRLQKLTPEGRCVMSVGSSVTCTVHLCVVLLDIMCVVMCMSGDAHVTLSLIFCYLIELRLKEPLLHWCQKWDLLCAYQLLAGAVSVCLPHVLQPCLRDFSPFFDCTRRFLHHHGLHLQLLQYLLP